MTNLHIKRKKIFVAGGAGLLGVNLTQRLNELGADVQSSYFQRKPPRHLQPCYRPYDFTDYQQCLSATRDAEYVIICAVQASGVAGMQRSPTGSVLPNLAMHAALFEACSQNSVNKVIWISSSTVYQEAFYPIREDQLDLNLPPYDLYQAVGWVYRYLEQLARCYLDKNGLQIAVLRTTNIYGPYDHFDDRKSHVIPALIKRALKRQLPFIVWGNGRTVRDFIYVDDLVQAVITVLGADCPPSPVNFSYGRPVPIDEIVRTILERSGHHVEPVFDADKPTAVPYRVLDNTRFEKLFGHINRTPPDKGIQKTIAWYTSDLARE